MGILDRIVYVLEAILAVNVVICLVIGAPLVRHVIRFVIAVSLVRGRKPL